MKNLILMTLLLTVYCSLNAQHPFSEKVVIYPQWEDKFLPYAKGEAKIIDEGTDDTFEYGYNGGEAQKLSGKTKNIVDFILRSSSINPLQGVGLSIFNKNQVGYYCDNKEKPKLLTSLIEIGFSVLVMGEDNNIHQEGSNAWTYIRINDPNAHSITNVMSIVGDDIFLEPTITGDFFGKPIYELHSASNERVIVYNGDIPLWIPATREECLTRAIAQVDNEIALFESEMNSTSDKSISEEFAIGKAQRQEDFEKAYKILLQIDPKEAAAFKKTHEALEKELAEDFALDPDANVSRKDIKMPGLGMHYKNKKELEDELASLTTTHKKEQAYWNKSNGNKASDMLFGLTTKNQYSHPLVRVNPALLKRKTTESDIWLISIEFTGAIPFSHHNYSYGKDGFMLAFQKQLEFAKDKKVWEYVFNMVENN